MPEDSPVDAPDRPLEPSVFPPAEPIAPESGKEIFPLSLLAACIVVPLSALVAGFAWHAVSFRTSDLLLISALIVGVVAGIVVGILLSQTRPPHLSPTQPPHVAVLMISGCVAAPFAMPVRFAFDANSHRPSMIVELRQLIADSHPSRSKKRVYAQAEAALTPWRTFTVYMEHLSENGVSIGSSRGRGGVGYRSERLRLRGGWLGGMYVVEAAAMACAGGFGALIGTQVSPKKCAVCGRSLTEYLLFRRHSSQSGTVHALAEGQHWVELSLTKREAGIGDKNATEVTILRCANATCPATVFVDTQVDTAIKTRLFQARISPESGDAARVASLAEL